VEALGVGEPLAVGLPLGVAVGVNPLGTIDGISEGDGEGEGLGDGDGDGVATAAHSVPGLSLIHI